MYCYSILFFLFICINIIISTKHEPKKVLITGFGPFKDYNPNPSLAAVEAIDKKAIEIECNHNIELHKEPIAVRYENVDLVVPALLDRVRPHLTIHVGVSDKASCFVLETQAYKHGYNKLDAADRKAAHHENPSPGLDSIVTSLDVDAIRKEFNSVNDGLHAEISHDAGRFLCEYIYYTSLSLDRCPTLFVHVPTEKYYKTEEVARGLERIIKSCLNQLEKTKQQLCKI